MPPLLANDFSSVFSFFMRLIGLNWSLMDGRSEMGCGLRAPKNEVGVSVRETERLREKGRGLAVGPAEGVEEPPGVKVLAAGFGLNSIALTLNLDAADAAPTCDFVGLAIRG